MKTLLLLRHAKSSWKDSGLTDHDRRLNDRGRRDAPRMGQLLTDENLLPDLILSSTANRARTSAELVAAGSGFDGEIVLDGNLYHALPESYLAVLAELPDNYNRVLVVGHNPGIEQLLIRLTGNHQRFATATLAHVSLDVQRWRELDGRTGAQLIQLWRPKELVD